jgi:HK97 family phage major capsid protein
MATVTEVPGGLGAAATPEAWAAFVLNHLSQQSVVLAAGATRVDTANKLIHIPRILTDAAAGWYAELATITSDAPVGNDLELTPKKVAALCQLSNEAVNDSSPSLLDLIGTSLTQSVALQADKALLVGTGGVQPTGVVSQASANVAGPISITTLITASGQVAAAGGLARAVFLNPADMTVLQLSKDSTGRPLLGPDYVTGPTSVIYGLALYPTTAMTAGEALVCDPAQIVVAIREDATVAVSQDFSFNTDATICRVIARLDVGVNDPRGLITISG